MIDPVLVLARFAKRTKDAKVKPLHYATAFGSNGNPVMDEVIFNYIEEMRDKNKPLYLGFTSYIKNHDKNHIIECTAIPLEYPYSKKAQLNERLAELALPYYEIDTQSDFTINAEARIVASFPFAKPVTDGALYTRVASLLWNEIGIDAHTDGCISQTFLFAPYYVNPKVAFKNADQPFLDAQAYRDAHDGVWVDARSQLTPKAKPQQVSDDGLFSW